MTGRAIAGKHRMPRPKQHARPVSRIYCFKQPQRVAAPPEWHPECTMSRSEMGTIVHVTSGLLNRRLTSVLNLAHPHHAAPGLVGVISMKQRLDSDHERLGSVKMFNKSFSLRVTLRTNLPMGRSSTNSVISSGDVLSGTCHQSRLSAFLGR